MRYRINPKKQEAQTAVEYMLLLAAVVAVVLVGFRNYIPRFYNTSNVYFNQVGIGVLGMENRCGDGVCSFEDCEKCPVDCGYCEN